MNEQVLKTTGADASSSGKTSWRGAIHPSPLPLYIRGLFPVVLNATSTANPFALNWKHFSYHKNSFYSGDYIGVNT